jgi:sarcosine oxidase subunit gamma
MAEGGISLREPEARAMVQIATITGMYGDRAAIERVLGAALPEIQRSTIADDATLLWTGPDQWWVLAARERGPDLVRALEDAAAGAFAVLDLGASRSVFRLGGPMAWRVLSKGSGMDFSPRAFLPGMCVATALARLMAVIHAAEDGASFDLFVYRSFRQELREWLAEASGVLSGGGVSRR